jgi:hypothetical protein
VLQEWVAATHGTSGGARRHYEGQGWRKVARQGRAGPWAPPFIGAWKSPWRGAHVEETPAAAHSSELSRPWALMGFNVPAGLWLGRQA